MGDWVSPEFEQKYPGLFNDRRDEGRRTAPMSRQERKELAPLLPRRLRHKEGSIRGTIDRHGLIGIGPYPLGPRRD